MVPDQGEHAWWGSLLHREAAESIDHLMARLVGLEDACCAFEPKDLLNAFPVLGKPVIEIRATGDLSVLEPPMPFVPGLGLFPTTTIRECDPQTDRQYPRAASVGCPWQSGYSPLQTDGSAHRVHAGYAWHPR